MEAWTLQKVSFTAQEDWSLTAWHEVGDTNQLLDGHKHHLLEAKQDVTSVQVCDRWILPGRVSQLRAFLCSTCWGRCARLSLCRDGLYTPSATEPQPNPHPTAVP